MEERQWEAGWEVDEVKKTGPHFQMEYLAIQEQRVALIRSYNFWYVFGVAASLSSYWLLMFMALSVSSLPLIVAAGVIGTTIVWFAYHVVINIDRGVVALYPRIVFLELLLGYDFYRDHAAEPSDRSSKNASRSTPKPPASCGARSTASSTPRTFRARAGLRRISGSPPF